MRIGRLCPLAPAVPFALALALLPATPAPAADCPNEAIREAQTSEALPQGTVGFPHCMALEMVSPARKFVQPAFSPAFSLDGERVRFRSIAALAGTPGLQNAFGDPYIATRTPGGWATEPTSPPVEAEIAEGAESQGGPFAFSPDFGQWVSFGASKTEATAGLSQLFSGGLGQPFEPLSPLLVPIDDSGNPNLVYNAANSQATGVSLDMSVAVFRSKLASTSYLPGDPRTDAEEEPGGDRDNYLAYRDGGGKPTVELLAREEDGTVHGGRCGTHLGGGIGGSRGTGRLTQGAIAPEGERIYFSTRPAQPFDEESAQGPPCDTANPLRIMVRSGTPAGPQIEELIEGDDPKEAGDDLYQGTSLDGSKVYLTTTRALASSDGDAGPQCSRTPGASTGCDLYLYDSSLPEGERLIQVSAGGPGSPTPGEGAGVLSSITAISSDGSHAYFVAEGVLTSEPNPEGDLPLEGQPNLYLYERDEATPSGHIAFIATLVPGDEGSSGQDGLWGSEQAHAGDAAAVPVHGAPGGGDGHILVFASEAQVTTDDEDEEADVFRYDSQLGTLQRITQAAPGGSEFPSADALVNPIPDGASPEGPRWVSEDGLAVAFATAEPLAPGDEDEAANPYLWREGELLRLPAAAGEEPPVLSADGSQVAFAAAEALLPTDGDTAKDVYLARAGGGFPNPAPPTICDPATEGSCRGALVQAPPAPAPASLTFAGPGNRKGPARCRKPKVRRKGRCAKPRKRAARKGAGRQAGRKGGARR